MEFKKNKFNKIFDHYEKMKQRKKPFGPVVLYEYDKWQISVHVKAKSIPHENKEVISWIVTNNFSKDYKEVKIFEDFETSIEYLEEKIKEVRFLLLY